LRKGSFHHIEVNSEGFIPMEHSKLLAGVPECFYLFLQFLRFLMIFKASLS